MRWPGFDVSRLSPTLFVGAVAAGRVALRHWATLADHARRETERHHAVGVGIAAVAPVATVALAVVDVAGPVVAVVTLAVAVVVSEGGPRDREHSTGRQDGRRGRHPDSLADSADHHWSSINSQWRQLGGLHLNEASTT